MIAKGLTLEAILASEALKGDIVKITNQRLRSSGDYYKDRLDTAIRCYKIYRAIKDEVDDDDETNTGACYAFGIIEDTVAAVSESILNSRVPTPARARKAGHEKKAENFNAMAQAYFSTGQYQEEYTGSVRERVIAGWNWEIDCWAWRYRKGKRWAKVPREDETGQTYTATEEIEQDVPIQVGYYTRFPSIFSIRPQPRVSTVEKMKWVLEIEERVAVEDLREQFCIDPASGERKPFFNLDEIDRDFPAGGSSITPTDVDDYSQSHEDQLREINDGTSGKSDDDFKDDMGQVTLVWVRETDRIWCIANGKYVVAYVEDLFHRPGLKVRLKKCTGVKDSLSGLGMIEPVEDLFYELDDIHILSMRNWMRIINKLVAYNPESVNVEDFKPRAGGKIRVSPKLGRSVSSEMHAFDHTDVTPSMLGQESNVKGLLERALGRPDYSPGYGGTKQFHETLGGIQKISAASDKRTAAIRRQELAGFQKQMYAMEGMYLQFQMEKMPFATYGPDGSTALLELDLWDIDTEGAGFDFVIEYDPAFGDDALARNQLMVLGEQAIKYNEAIMAQFPPGSKPLIQIDEIARRTLRVSGFNDTSRILVRPDGVLDPEAELRLMMQGKPVMVNPKENMVEHYAMHAENLQSPMLREAVEKGAAPPDLLLRIKSHIEATAMAIKAALMDPSGIIRERKFGPQGPPPGQGEGPRPQMQMNRREGVTNFGPRVPQA